jgi:hypothetical protein
VHVQHVLGQRRTERNLGLERRSKRNGQRVVGDDLAFGGVGSRTFRIDTVDPAPEAAKGDHDPLVTRSDLTRPS